MDNFLINGDPTTPNFSFTSLLMADDDDVIMTPPPPPPSPPPPHHQIIPFHIDTNNDNDNYTLESIIENYVQKKRKRGGPTTTATSSSPLSSTKQSISQKAYRLSKLLPGDKVITSNTRKKNTIEVLDDACKYVKFLQAQVDALKSMPVVSGGGFGGGGGGGWWLSRQQVLEVVVNSPVVQMVMAENGWCVVAAEQVEVMNRIEARKRLVHHLLANLPL